MPAALVVVGGALVRPAWALVGVPLPAAAAAAPALDLGPCALAAVPVAACPPLPAADAVGFTVLVPAAAALVLPAAADEPLSMFSVVVPEQPALLRATHAEKQAKRVANLCGCTLEFLCNKRLSHVSFSVSCGSRQLFKSWRRPWTTTGAIAHRAIQSVPGAQKRGSREPGCPKPWSLARVVGLYTFVRLKQTHAAV
jgi:hypothetical protein